MTINSKYVFVASMDVDPDKEALFNEVYDTEHIPNLLKVQPIKPRHWVVSLVAGILIAVLIGAGSFLLLVSQK